VNRLLATVAASALLAVAGCGDDGEAGSGSAAPVGYVPADTPALIEITTDLESEQWQALEEQLLAGPLSPESLGETLELGALPPPTDLEGFIRQLSAFAGLDYDEDVEPLLGGSLVLAAGPEAVGGEEDSVVAALGGVDDEVLEGVLTALELSEQAEYEGASVYADESGFTQFAVDGDVIVYATGSEDFEAEGGPPVPSAALTEAIDREREGSGLDPEALAVDGLAEDALIRLHGDLSAAIESPDLAPVAGLPWIAGCSPSTPRSRSARTSCRPTQSSLPTLPR